MRGMEYVRKIIVALLILSAGFDTLKGDDLRAGRDEEPGSMILNDAHAALYSNPDSALMILEHSKELFEATDDIALKAAYFHQKGLIYHVKSNATEALSYYQESYKLYRQAGDSVMKNVMLINISGCYSILAQYAGAKKILNRILPFFERRNDSASITNIYLNLSFVHIEAMEYDVAEAYLRSAAGYVTDRVKEGRIMNNLGEVLIKENRDDDALATFHKALTIAKEADDNLTVTMILNNIGCLYMSTSGTDSAYYYFNRVLSMNRSFVEDRLLITTFRYLALMERDHGNPEAMMRYFNRALELAAANNYEKEKAEIYSLMSDWYAEVRDYEKAYRYKNISTIINDSLFNEVKSRQIKEIEAIYQNEKKQEEINVLSAQNTVNMLKLRNNRVLIVSLLLLALFIMSVSLLLIHQHKLKAKTESILLEQKLLRSQMNPHFIFNALSAIQSQVLQKQAIEAASYISGFARLMRSILNSSRSEVITLENEIETVSEYLSLQKLRLKDRLQYHLSVDMPFDTSDIVIPPMLLQPFIENAVEHGIAKKQIPEGNIWITFRARDDRLSISVEDDGVGLTVTASDTKESLHKSLATRIIHERMAALKKSFKKEFSYIVTNRVNDDGAVNGALVTIDIPLLFNDK